MVSKTDDTQASEPGCRPADVAVSEAGHGAQDAHERSKAHLKDSRGCGEQSMSVSYMRKEKDCRVQIWTNVPVSLHLYLLCFVL